MDCSRRVRCSNRAKTSLRQLLAKAVNPNQFLILNEIAYNEGSISSLLNRISARNGVPLSTLKLNAKVLARLGVISYGSTPGPRQAALTEAGETVLSLMLENEKVR